MDTQITIQNGNHYNALIGQIAGLLQQGRQRAAYAVNTVLLSKAYTIALPAGMKITVLKGHFNS